MNLYLSGMIGSGKTTIGWLIAERLELPFLDLDREMERILGYSFHQLVEKKGWLPFRELEYTLCRGFARRSRVVVALGGGTVRYEWNRDALAGSGLMVLLEVSPEELIRRVRQADRPRVNAGTTLEEDVRLMWEREREKYYRAADLVYRAEGKEPATEADELIDRLRADPRLDGLFATRPRAEGGHHGQ